METVQLLTTATSYLVWGIFILIAVAGFIGAALAVGTREDAFEVAGRQSKLIWVALLVASGFALLLNIPFLSWAGIVIIGLYWWDVRPQIKSILEGHGGW